MLDLQKIDFRKVKVVRSKAIRLKCVDCTNYQQAEIPLCTIYHCPLYPYRMGNRSEKTQKLVTITSKDGTIKYSKGDEPVV